MDSPSDLSYGADGAKFIEAISNAIFFAPLFLEP